MDGAPVAQRRVFYIPGYDPFPARRYRELYRSEGARQAEISRYGLEMLPGSAPNGSQWTVVGEIEGARVESRITVLGWSDLVRKSMDASVAGTYLALVRTAWIYISTGVLRRLMLLRKGPIIAALYPVGMLLLQALAALLAALIVRSFIFGGLGWLGWRPGGWIGFGLTLVILAGVIPPVLHLLRRLDGKLYAYYLMNDYAYSARELGAYPAALEARLAHFADQVAEAAASGVDEVLVVGHSSGAHLAVSILADLERAGRLGPETTTISLLTLGQVIPMISFLPRAQRLRRDLNTMARSTRVYWLDVTAPTDGCAFALVDPVAVTGVAPPDQTGPLVLSAAFSKHLSAEAQEAQKWRYFQIHFQYLRAFDKPGDYDYFKTTAGPKTLRDRYGFRLPSPSRVDIEVSGHTDMEPA